MHVPVAALSRAARTESIGHPVQNANNTNKAYLLATRTRPTSITIAVSTRPISADHLN